MPGSFGETAGYRACVVLAIALIAACSRRDDPVRKVPENELARPAPSASIVPQCDPPCEAGAACIEGLCAESIDWARRATRTEGTCPVGERHAVSCPKTAVTTMSVWGSDVYTADSSICAAALHAGKITAAGGEVVYEFRPGLSSYEGSARHGVTTGSWAAYECSLVVTSKACAPGLVACGGACADLQSNADHCGACGAACALGDSCRKGACTPGLDADYTTVAGMPCTGARKYNCPPLAGATIGTVWGSGPYTGDSSVCGAGVHAGAITAATGGTVSIELLPGLPSYAGSTRNGIKTNAWASWSCSFRVK